MRFAPLAPILLAPCLLAPVAAADDLAPPEVIAPTFSTLSPDGSHGNEVGADLIALFPRGPEGGEDPLLNLRVGGTLLHPDSGAGGYGTIGLTTGGDETGVGNLELGGLVRRDVSPSFAVAARLGVALGIASDDDGGFEHYLATLLSRPAEVAQSLQDFSSVRAAVTPTWWKDNLFLRVELGVDVVVEGDESNPLDPLIHGALAAGFSFGGFAATVEYQALRWPDDGDTAVFHAIAMSAQHGTEQLAIYGGLAKPFGGPLEGLDVLDLFLGVKARL